MITSEAKSIFRLRKKVEFRSSVAFADMRDEDFNMAQIYLERFVSLPGSVVSFPSFIQFDGEVFSGPIIDSAARVAREKGTKFYLCDEKVEYVKPEELTSKIDALLEVGWECIVSVVAKKWERGIRICDPPW